MNMKWEHELVPDAKIFLEKARIDWRGGDASIQIIFKAPEDKRELMQAAVKKFEEIGINMWKLKGDHVLSFDFFLWEDKPFFKGINNDFLFDSDNEKAT